MNSWNGVANCPQCGCEGTLLVSGGTSKIEIEGCWVCGFGRDMEAGEAEFVPLHRLNLQRRTKKPHLPMN